MRVFQIVLEVLWAVMGLFCLFLSIRNWGHGGNAPLMFLGLACVAFAMGTYRFLSRRKRERQQNSPRSLPR